LNFEFPSLKRFFAAERGLLCGAAVVLAAGILHAQGPSAKPVDPVALPLAASGDAIAGFPVTTDPVLMQAMEAELHRAMTELGTAASVAKPAASAKDTASTKPNIVIF
jgi:hypothetical protein